MASSRPDGAWSATSLHMFARVRGALVRLAILCSRFLCIIRRNAKAINVSLKKDQFDTAILLKWSESQWGGHFRHSHLARSPGAPVVVLP